MPLLAMITKEESYQLFKQFENCTLDAALFNQKTHLEITWYLIKNYDLEEATALNNSLTEKYYNSVLKLNHNPKLTNAYTEIIHHFMSKSSSDSFDGFLREFPRLKYNFKRILETHYGYNILKEQRVEKEKPLNRPIFFTF
ncbi:hypothetical protein [Lutibacter sp.]